LYIIGYYVLLITDNGFANYFEVLINGEMSPYVRNEVRINCPYKSV